MRKIIYLILCITPFTAFGQNREQERPAHIKMDSVQWEAGPSIWDIYPMAEDSAYFISMLAFKERTLKRDKKKFKELIKKAKAQRPKTFYLIFETVRRQKVQSPGSSNYLVVEKLDFKSYMEINAKFKPGLNEDLLRKRVLVFKVKEMPYGRMD